MYFGDDDEEHLNEKKIFISDFNISSLFSQSSRCALYGLLSKLRLVGRPLNQNCLMFKLDYLN